MPGASFEMNCRQHTEQTRSGTIMGFEKGQQQRFHLILQTNILAGRWTKPLLFGTTWTSNEIHSMYNKVNCNTETHTRVEHQRVDTYHIHLFCLHSHVPGLICTPDTVRFSTASCWNAMHHILASFLLQALFFAITLDCNAGTVLSARWYAIQCVPVAKRPGSHLYLVWTSPKQH